MSCKDKQTSYLGMTGAKIFHEMLKEQGVEVLFGYPGGVLLPIFDELYDSPIKFVLTRHEQGACHMADGYARSTGKTGVVIATSGPGATNIVTGLATANMDSIPLVAFTGQVKTQLIGNDAFQEADMTGITRPVTKHNFLVKDVKDLGRIIKEAFHIASSGRPGPVLVDIPVDTTINKLEQEPGMELSLPGYKPRGGAGNERQIKLAAETINQAKRPVLYVGGGVILSGASDELRALAKAGNLPTTTTLMGLGTFDESDPLALKMLGMHGTAYANHAVQSCDCLVSIGARFDDRVTGDLAQFAPHAKIIHIDIDGDIRPQEVCEMIGEMTDHDAIIATGVGQHQMWAAQFCGWRKPRQLLTSGGLGTMGYGVPAAIGAQFAHPDKLVIDIDGDGSFSMTMIEIMTAVRYNMPTKFVVLDNDYLGMVRQWQQLFYDRRYSGVDHPCPNFVKIIEGFGAQGITITDRADLAGGVKTMLDSSGPFLLHVCVAKEENVYPMVAAGRALHDMIHGELI